MNLQRWTRHLLTPDWSVRRAFPRATMTAIAEAIRATESVHGGEIRFAVEAALEPWELMRGMTPRERAIDVFSELRVWDTQHNNGVLIYVLLADHAVEIVADRGIHAHEGTDTWSAICRQIEAAFGRADYRSGALLGVEAVARALKKHFPQRGGHPNELPDEPAVLS